MTQVGYIEPALFIYMLCLFYSYPIEQQLVYRKVCLSHYNNTFCTAITAANSSSKSSCSSRNNSREEDIIQEETAVWDMYNSIARTLPAIISTILLGAWSDGVGRKKVLIFPVLGETINGICYVFNVWFLSASPSYLLIGNTIAGCFGSFASLLMIIFTYIADVTTIETRTGRISILEAVISLAAIISYLSGGVIVERFGFLAIYILVLGLYVALVIYIFFLKESYYPTTEIQLSNVICQNKIAETFHLFAKRPGVRYRFKLWLLIGCFFIFFFQFMGLNAVTILYVLHKPLCFQPSSIGYLLAEGSVARFIGVPLIVTVVIKRLKWHDYSLIVLNSIMMIALTLCLGLSRTQWQVYLSVLCGLGLGVGSSACRSGLSKLMSADEQGKMSSVIGILQMVSTLTASIAFNTFYKLTVHISPSFTFYIIAGLTVVPLLLSILLMVYGRGDSESYNNLVDNIERVTLIDMHEEVDTVAEA